MRGKVTYKDSGKDASRITPAYAGKRAFELVVQVSDWDHPRVCGEKTKKIP